MSLPVSHATPGEKETDKFFNIRFAGQYGDNRYVWCGAGEELEISRFNNGDPIVVCYTPLQTGDYYSFKISTVPTKPWQEAVALAKKTFHLRAAL